VAKTNFAEVALNTPAYRQYKTQKRRLTSESGIMLPEFDGRWARCPAGISNQILLRRSKK
jgi:hypothetical protein